MFHTVLIANRGEIACRVAATARRLGIRTVAVYSDADAQAKHVQACDEAVHIGPPPAAQSYLLIDKILETTRPTPAPAAANGNGTGNGAVFQLVPLRWPTTTAIAGSMIGSGVFIVAADMVRSGHTGSFLLWGWALTAVLTVLGALSYGELAGMFPHAGGQYTYLREIYGPLTGFLYGWTLFLVIQTGFNAAVAIAFGPVFASNIVFATRFDTTEDATGAFAANLLGAMVGGCLEYLSLLMGYQWLIAVAAVIYLIAVLFGIRASKRQSLNS